MIQNQSYRIDNLPERYYEAVLKNTELTKKKNKDVIKALRVIEIEVSLTITAFRNEFIR